MQTHAQRMREIVKADNARRADRVIAELALFDTPSNAPEGIDPYLWDRSITGVPSAGNRQPKASPNSWVVGLHHKCVGVATGTETTHKGAPTVRVITADTNTVRPVSDFAKARDTRAVVRVKREAVVPETARIAQSHDFTSH